ncbi:gonadotropin-releasing hormone receptor [Trichonephila clavipes]|uniref:Gonadotropin-releasing hormone receptor n=1 Tax=Trichonephila clavipes TaxID=2585209 RepID=A0A8X6R5R4_TRICX|nr:gonadotropin-releasing hormone receptor [Trichonephila clavipes]
MAGQSMEIEMLKTDHTYVEEYYMEGANDSSNGSMDYQGLPYYLTINEDSIREIVLYSFMFFLSVFGNFPVFVSLIENKQQESRVNLMITHLVIANLIVTFIVIPLEIAWNITVKWMVGNIACKILVCIRSFGQYLSSSVLVCISVDQYISILYPLKLNGSHRRCKIMVGLAWATSILCSIPQEPDLLILSLLLQASQHVHYHRFPYDLEQKKRKLVLLCFEENRD